MTNAGGDMVAGNRLPSDEPPTSSAADKVERDAERASAAFVRLSKLLARCWREHLFMPSSMTARHSSDFGSSFVGSFGGSSDFFGRNSRAQCGE
jgi:hypothetical protein